MAETKEKSRKVDQIRPTERRDLDDATAALQGRVSAFEAAGSPVFERNKAGELRVAPYSGGKPAGAPDVGTLAPYDPGHKKRGIPPRGRREDAYRFPGTVDELRVEVGASLPGVTRAADLVTPEPKSVTEPLPSVTKAAQTVTRPLTPAEKQKAYRERQKAKKGN